MSTFLSDGGHLERGVVEVRGGSEALLVTGPDGLLVQAIRCAGGWDLVIYQPGRKAEGPQPLRQIPDKEQDALRKLAGRRVAVARKAAGLSQRAMARQLGRSNSWVREIESGSQWPPAYLLVSLAEATGRPVGWFYGQP